MSATVTVTWMDGTQEAYAADWAVEAGALLWLTAPDGARCIPLCNVKFWQVT